METRFDYTAFGLGGGRVIRRRSDNGTSYHTSTGCWTTDKDDPNIAFYDEHGANLFLVGYEQAQRDAARALGITTRVL